MVSRPSWAQWSCEVVCVAIAAVAPTMVTPEDRGGLVDEGAMQWYSLVYVCRCGDRPLRPEGWYSMATPQ